METDLVIAGLMAFVSVALALVLLFAVARATREEPRRKATAPALQPRPASGLSAGW